MDQTMNIMFEVAHDCLNIMRNLCFILLRLFVHLTDVKDKKDDIQAGSRYLSVCNDKELYTVLINDSVELVEEVIIGLLLLVICTFICFYFHMLFCK